MILAELLEKTVTTNASDLHLIAGIAPNIRVDGRLIPLSAYPPLSNEEIQNLVFSILTPEQKELFLTNRSLDFSYGYGGGDYGEKGRFRINLYFQRNTVAAAFRLLPPKVKTIEELRLPPIAHNFAKIKQGFVLVTGPTGHGKSTTLASIKLPKVLPPPSTKTEIISFFLKISKRSLIFLGFIIKIFLSPNT